MWILRDSKSNWFAKITWIDSLLYLVFQKEPLDLNKSFVKSELFFIFRIILLHAELWDLKKVFLLLFLC